MPNEVARVRVGFVVSKPISKLAVERNYIKRLLSEAIRPVLPALPIGWDIVLRVKHQGMNADLRMFERDVAILLHRSKLLASLPEQFGLDGQPVP